MCFSFPFFFNAYTMKDNERVVNKMEYNFFIAMGMLFMVYWVFSCGQTIYEFN